MFPENSGVFIAQHDDGSIVMVKVKGVYPTLQLDKNAIDISAFLRTGTTQQVPKSMLDNIELFHTEWRFVPLKFNNFNVFSRTDFAVNGKLYLSDEDIVSLQGKYYRLCQQGVSPMKVIRALSYEYKVPTDQIIPLINCFDAQAVIE